MFRPFATLALLLALLSLAACGKDDDAGIAGRDNDDEPSTTASASTPPPTAQPTPARTRRTSSGCRAVEPPPPKGDQDRDRPELRLDEDRTYIAIVRTTCGTIEIRLDSDESPRTTASFVALARDDFYDDLTVHRVARPSGTPFVVQGGDPTGTGNGDPGYTVVEPPPDDVVYRRGVVAMAKSEIEEPGTSGSQFFIITADRVELPPVYAVLGRVADGLDAVDRISNTPTDPTTEVPTEPIVIEDVEIRERD